MLALLCLVAAPAVLAPSFAQASGTAAAGLPNASPHEALVALREALRAGDAASALAHLRDAVDGLRPPELAGASEHLALLLELDGIAQELGALPEKRRLREALLVLQRRFREPDHPEVLLTLQSLGLACYELDDAAAARDLFAELLEARERLLPEGDLDRALAAELLGSALSKLEDFAPALQLFEQALEARRAALDPAHPSLLTLLRRLARAHAGLGDLEGLRAREEEVLARLAERDAPELLEVRDELARMLLGLGDAAGAREQLQAVVDALSLTRRPHDPALLVARGDLGAVLLALREHAAALEHLEAVLAARADDWPGDADLLGVANNLAAARYSAGDLWGAAELYARLLAELDGRPGSAGLRLQVLHNAALARRALGDTDGARALQERLVEALQADRPRDDPDVLAARDELAVTMRLAGEPEAALELAADVLAAREGKLPPDHPDVVLAREHLGAALYELGDLDSALEAFTRVLEERRRAYPPLHPLVLVARQNLAAALVRRGEPAAALEHLEEVLAARSSLLPVHHPDLLDARQNIAAALLDLGETERVRALVAEQLDGLVALARALEPEPPRRARAGARRGLERLSSALALAESADEGGALDGACLAALESLRAVSVASVRAARAAAADPELSATARRVAEVRARLNDLAASGPSPGADAGAWSAELLALAERRDRAAGELRSALAARGLRDARVDAPAIAAALGPRELAVSFVRYRNDLRRGGAGEDVLLAYAIAPDGRVRRTDLGPASELEELVLAWRRSLGRPEEGRGLSAPPGEARAADGAAGRRLRERLVDPLTAGTAVRALRVVLDDFLHLVPLDALPLDGDGLLGERVAILHEVSLAALLHPVAPHVEGGDLVVAGGIDYGAAPSGTEAPSAREPRSGAESEADGSAPLPRFVELPATREEAEAVARLFASARGGVPRRLEGRRATKLALAEAAPGARFLHLATHGWFDAGSDDAEREDDPLATALRRADELRTALTPETRCGIALAGANGGADAAGRRLGILTAEELAGLDLSRCELAVLSACETNVGVRSAGQGLHSLQTALHAAGARTAITSLWKVDDAATRELFERFYAALWEQGLGAADALWRAKTALRGEGHPARDWAGWVLSGHSDSTSIAGALSPK